MRGTAVKVIFDGLRTSTKGNRSFSFAQPQVSIAGDSKYVVITPGVDKDGKPLPPATSVCFFLHGLGDCGQSFAGMFFQIAIRMQHVKFVLPTAKSMKVTANKGAEMPAWYDLEGKPNRALEACHGIEATHAHLSHMIGKEMEGGISERRIVLGGFSQGGASALFSGIRQPHGLAGIMGLHSYLPLPDLTNSLTLSPSAKKTPILLCRGSEDEVVTPEATAHAAAVLNKVGFTVDVRTVDHLGHSIDHEVIEHVSKFLKTVLPR